MGVRDLWNSLRKLLGQDSLDVPDPDFKNGQKVAIVRDVMTFMRTKDYKCADKSVPEKADLTTPLAMVNCMLSFLPQLLDPKNAKVHELVLVADVSHWVPKAKLIEQELRGNHSDARAKEIDRLQLLYPVDLCIFSRNGVSVNGGPILPFPLSLMDIRPLRRRIIKCLFEMMPAETLRAIPVGCDATVVLDLDDRSPLVSRGGSTFRIFDRDPSLANEHGEGDLKMAEHADRLLRTGPSDLFLILQTTDSDVLPIMAPLLWPRLETEHKWQCTWSSGTNPSGTSTDLRRMFTFLAENFRMSPAQFMAMAILTGSDYFIKKSALHYVGPDTIVDAILKACKDRKIPREFDDLRSHRSFVRLVAVCHHAHCEKKGSTDDGEWTWDTIRMSRIRAPDVKTKQRSDDAGRYGGKCYVVPASISLVQCSFRPLADVVMDEQKHSHQHQLDVAINSNTALSPSVTFGYNMDYWWDRKDPGASEYFRKPNIQAEKK